jgi:hypothetical protein
VIAIYPITPASPMGELADACTAAGQPNLWGGLPSLFEGQHAGARDLVLLNRFYQPSHSFERRLPLRWIAILRGSEP